MGRVTTKLLRQLQIYQGTRCLYGAQYGKSLDDSSFSTIFLNLQQELHRYEQNVPDLFVFDYFRFRVSAIHIVENDILIILITDVTDTQDRIKRQLITFREEFLKIFGTNVDLVFNNRDRESLNAVIEKLQKGLFPKISFVGYSGVGKTTLTRLMLGAEIPRDHIPTITGTISMVQIGSIVLNIWDEAGQEQFQFVWSKLLQGSDVIFIVTDSTAENVEKSAYFVDLARKEAPQAHLAIIGNKQDLPGAISVLEITRRLGGIRTFSMVAADPANRQKIFNIITDILEILPQNPSSPQLLIKRDRLREDLNAAVKSKDHTTELGLLKELEKLYDELGDEAAAKEYQVKASQLQLAVPNKIEPAHLVSLAPSNILSSPERPLQQAAEEPTKIPLLPPKSDTSGTFSLMQTPKLVPTSNQKLQVYETIWKLSLKKVNLEKHIRILEQQAELGSLSVNTFHTMKQKAIEMQQDIDHEITQYKALLQKDAAA